MEAIYTTEEWKEILAKHIYIMTDEAEFDHIQPIDIDMCLKALNRGGLIKQSALEKFEEWDFSISRNYPFMEKVPKGELIKGFMLCQEAVNELKKGKDKN